MHAMNQNAVQKLSWIDYAFAAFASYLMTWLAIFFWECWRHFILSHPFNRFHPADPIPAFSDFLRMTLPAAINFLILLPFLRFPVRRRIAYVCLFAVWIFVLWFFQAETR
jgi:hypothetical protein